MFAKLKAKTQDEVSWTSWRMAAHDPPGLVASNEVEATRLAFDTRDDWNSIACRLSDRDGCVALHPLLYVLANVPALAHSSYTTRALEIAVWWLCVPGNVLQ